MNFNFSSFNSLDIYGFKSHEQKSALQQLLQRANIIFYNESIHEVFPVRNNYHDLATDIIYFVSQIQEKFTIRKGHQERWHVKSPEWIKNNVEENLESLKTIGIISSVYPRISSPDAICILGATMPTMKNRFEYFTNIIEHGIQTKNLILLSGERYVTVNLDGSEEELHKIAIKNNLENILKLTEAHLIEEIYKNSSFYDKIPTHIVDTPARDLPRPTTQTTVVELVKWLKDHDEIKSIIFISNQPYVKYQEATIAETFRSLDFNINFEVIGNAYQNDSLQSAIESLGSYIYAKTPDLFFQANESISDPKIIESLTELYSRQPLIYHNLEHIFLKNCTSEIIGQSLSDNNP